MTWFVVKVNASKPFIPVIEEGLKHANQIIVIDKKCGAGFATVDHLIDGKIKRVKVDADNFEATEEGLYLSVNSFHQFTVKEAKEILAQVSKNRQPIVVVEGNNDSLWQVFGMTVIVPLTVILTAPFVKPFRLERLVFTYLIPLLPSVTFLDGFIALFKLYAPKDLDELTASLNEENYYWRSGKMDNGRGGKIIFLIGHPVK
ncbi:MAG: hypothetical protein IPK35_21345 [Saprospiraceae bacterium]|nr:hypothetical protein [Saprospiraceae bacterium]